MVVAEVGAAAAPPSAMGAAATTLAAEARGALLAGLRRVLRAVLTALVAAAASALALALLDWSGAARAPAAGGPALAGLPALTEHEARLAGQVERPAGRGGLDALGGMPELKRELRQMAVLPLRSPRAFFGGPASLEPQRGLLLVGPPGTGKTTLARAVAEEAGVRLVAVALSSLEDKYVGESGKLLAAAFSLAAKAAPCVLFFDELDGLMRERSAADGAAAYSLKADFLVQLDRWEARPELPVVIIGATNNAASLDPALRRRLPAVLPVPPPDRPARADILRLLLRREPAHARGLPAAARRAVLDGTAGGTGSDLRALYRAAAALRLRRQLDEDPAFAGLVQAGEAAPIEAALRPIAVADWDAALAGARRGAAAAAVDHCSRPDPTAGAAAGLGKALGAAAALASRARSPAGP